MEATRRKKLKNEDRNEKNKNKNEEKKKKSEKGGLTRRDSECEDG